LEIDKKIPIYRIDKFEIISLKEINVSVEIKKTDKLNPE
tara:strand:- start:2810 stop:2926 length:117 start_codon:yes stop_codon:yes gene_type:complete